MHNKREDYLRAIFELDASDGVKSSQLAKSMKISKPSVSEMLRKLSSQGFVKFKSYSRVYLTKKGFSEAESILSKHELVEKFFTRILKHSDKEAHEQSRVIAPELSLSSIKKLKDFIYGSITYSNAEERFDISLDNNSKIPAYLE